MAERIGVGEEWHDKRNIVMKPKKKKRRMYGANLKFGIFGQFPQGGYF